MTEKATNDPVAAAIILLANKVLKSAQLIAEEIKHQNSWKVSEMHAHHFCLALRAALLGREEPEDITSSISNTLSEIAEAIRNR
ncbi:MAG TPA: hypothetical protein VGE74_32245 [Gemmata sp.]